MRPLIAVIGIIVHTPERVCYTTTAFIGRKDAVNSKTVAKAVVDAWEELGLPRDRVGVVLVDMKAFRGHLAAFFGNAGLRTCWAHSANKFGAAMQEHKGLADMRNYMRWMCSLLWGAQQAQRRQRYIAFIGATLLDYTATRWSSSMEIAAHHSKKLRAESHWVKQEAEDHKKKREKEIDENGEVVQLPTVLQNALDVLEKKRMLRHLSLTFYAGMGDPIYKFIEGLQVDIVLKSCRGGERRPIAHRLYARVPELEAKLENLVQDVTQVPEVLALFDLLKQYDLRASRISMLLRVGQKVLAVVQKYKRNQLGFFDEVRVFDLGQHDSMRRDINHYTLLFLDTTARH